MLFWQKKDQLEDQMFKMISQSVGFQKGKIFKMDNSNDSEAKIRSKFSELV